MFYPFNLFVFMNKKITGLLLALFIVSQVIAQTKFTIEDFVVNYSFYPNSVYGLRSMNDGKHYTTLNRQATAIEKFSYATGNKVDDVLNYGSLAIGNVIDYEFSADESKLLLLTKREALYRRSFFGTYYVYDLKTKQIQKLTDKGRERLATLSPDGSKVAYVYENDLYIKDLASSAISQITTDGEWNKIINGAPDWVYEEEFEYNKAFEWSVDSKKLAYCKFDESQVKEFSMTMFQASYPKLAQNALYPEVRTWKYPKAGDDNSKVTVHVYDLASAGTLKVDVGSETDQYIPRIKWTQSPTKFAVYRLNRLQNTFELLMAEAATGATFVLYTEENKYYVDEGMFDHLDFLPGDKNWVMMSEKSGYTHIYLYDMQGKLVKQLTSGNFDVTEFHGYDSKKQLVYYTAAEESPLRREMYCIGLNGKGKKRLTTESGTNSVTFSSSFDYYTNEFSSVSKPTTVTLHDASGKQIRVLESNDEFKELLKSYSFNYKEFFQFTTADNVTLNGWMLKPVNFDPNKKYKVLMTQYSGPNSQEVRDSWDMGWEYLLAQDSILVVCVDGRGTGARGEEFRKMTYLQLGKYEVIDQIATAKYLGTLPYVAKEHIGIWGWSYGGFMTLLGLTKGEGVFSCGISVAPVTNWRFYDNIYTERFMRKPQDNASGYDDNSPLTHAAKLQGKLLLVHGSADDNVHLQNSMEFTDALVQANIPFEQMIFPNRNHGIYGGNTRLFLYNKFYDFLKKNL